MAGVYGEPGSPTGSREHLVVIRGGRTPGGARHGGILLGSRSSISLIPMITIEKNRSWTGVAIVAAVAAAGALAWWGLSKQDEEGGDARVPEPAAAIWQWSSASGAASAEVQTPSIFADARLSGVQAEDLAALEASLGRGHPNAKAEAARIVSYVQFNRTFEAWQALDEQKQLRERRQLAEGLFRELPDRLKSGEFTLMEAALMGAVLIADAEPDEARRTQRGEAWQAQLVTIVPNPEDEARMAAQNRETEYMRRRGIAKAGGKDSGGFL